MLSILVCHSYYLRLDHKQVLRAKPYPPLAHAAGGCHVERGRAPGLVSSTQWLAEGIDEYECLPPG